MCGIAGFTHPDNSIIENMIATLKHRGPNQQGTYSDDAISLGHTRLCIIDLSEDGKQPMSNEDGSVWLLLNGEIYNFQDLRQELRAKGHQFKSRTDSEVIIHLYEEDPNGFLARLQGMFAMAIWDTKRQKLILARDRIGIKPLYYTIAENQLIFASEIKAILEHPAVTARLNHQAVFDFLGWEFTPTPDTMFSEIYKLPAAHRLDYEKKSTSISRYWQLNFSPAPYKTMDDAVLDLRESLDSAVQSHLVSDVPLGVFLSGGLDSSALIAMMRNHVGGPINTYSIEYADKSFSETEYAEIVSKYFNTNHSVLRIESLSPETLEKAVWHLDEPMTDLSAVPLMLACEKGQADATVFLSGEGGDELFAGYDRFKAAKLDKAYSKIPKALRNKLISPLIDRLSDQDQKKGLINKLKRFDEGARLDPSGEHLRWQYFLDPRHDQQLFKPDYYKTLITDRFRAIKSLTDYYGIDDMVNREVMLDISFTMVDSILMKVDKMSMANSIEIRVPLLDHVFVEHVNRYPGDWKLHGNTTKAIFRRAMEGLLPDTIIRRGKQGYSAPIKHLLRGLLKDYTYETIFSSNIIRDSMQLNYIDKLINQHLAKTHNHNHILWALINLALWEKRFKVSI